MPRLIRLVVVAFIAVAVHEAGHDVIILGCLASAVELGGEEAALEVLISGMHALGATAAHEGVIDVKVVGD